MQPIMLKEVSNGSFILLLITSIFLFFLLRRAKPRRLPPGPERLPVIGNLHQIGHSLHHSLQHLAKEHGPLMTLQLGSVQAIVISSARMAQDILKAHDLIFSGKPPSQALKRLSYNYYDIFSAPYGEHWRQARKIGILELFSIKRVISFSSVRMEEVIALCETIASTRGPVNLSELMVMLANNVICRIAFGQKKFDKFKFHKLLNDTQHVLGEANVADFFPWLGWINKLNGFDGRLEKCFRELDRFYDELMEEHHRVRSIDSDHKDLVDVLLELQSDDSNQATTLSNDQIKGILMNILTGGTDTSSAILVWTMAELIKNPATLEAVQDEVTRVADGKEWIEEKDVSKLEYLHMVVKEAFRLHPPLPFLPRATIEDCEIMGYEIPAKTTVFINVKEIGRDPSAWVDPYHFKPERFLNSSIDFRGQNFELIPFGVGRRGCPGLNLATPLIGLALANLLYRFDWSLPRGMSPDDVDMIEDQGITVQKKMPLLLAATPRKNK
ncbi:hypothetical protein Dimus_023755 [Dionaea muscipula]